MIGGWPGFCPASHRWNCIACTCTGDLRLVSDQGRHWVGCWKPRHEPGDAIPLALFPLQADFPFGALAVSLMLEHVLVTRLRIPLCLSCSRC